MTTSNEIQPGQRRVIGEVMVGGGNRKVFIGPAVVEVIRPTSGPYPESPRKWLVEMAGHAEPYMNGLQVIDEADLLKGTLVEEDTEHRRLTKCLDAMGVEYDTYEDRGRLIVSLGDTFVFNPKDRTFQQTEHSETGGVWPRKEKK
jgi:hypothetical protein